METQTKICQNCKNEFVIEPEDFLFYEKMKVPSPTFCPECRMVRRMMFRNLKTLYKRKVEGVEKEVFAMIAPESSLKVVDEKLFWQNEIDGTKYGKNYDFSKPFFEQFKELMLEVPFPHKWSLSCVNSEYCNNVVEMKNSYLVFNSGSSENIYYGVDVLNSKDCVDVSKIYGSESSYELLSSEKCNKAFFCAECGDSYNIYFSHKLSDCHDCFLCSNLSHKSYCILNVEYSKEEYFEKLKNFDFGSYQNILKYKKMLEELRLKFPVKFYHGYGNKNSEGDYIEHCNNVHKSFNIQNSENCSYCQYVTFVPGKDSCDMTVGAGELSYEIGEAVGYNLKFSWYNFAGKMDIKSGLRNFEYTITSANSSDLFGCVGLNNKQYCILNKQYSKEEYEILVPKIKRHMDEMPYIDEKGRVFKYGEFFPYDISPYAYNETLAQEYFPLTAEDAAVAGYRWRNPDEKNYNITLKPEDLPDNIKDVDENIIKEIIGCEHERRCMHECSKAFKIVKEEFEFYKKFNIALPRLCPNCRHGERVKNRNPMKLWKRKCNCNIPTSDVGIYINTAKHFHGSSPCPNEFETTYSPDRKEIVYCEECYKAEIY